MGLAPSHEDDMYRTSRGDRVLEGAERRLFVESLGRLVDDLSTGDFDLGIPPFDELQRNQKFAALHLVARGLLCPDQPPPPLTAILEATVAGVYLYAGDMLEGELAPEPTDDESNPFGPAYVVEPELPTWRQLVLAACRQREFVGDLPDPDDVDFHCWEYPLEFLEQCVLWDTDWALLEHLDADPETSQRSKKLLGIEEDYFVAVPPEPNDAQAARLLDELVELTMEAR
jgi:hypothetical protein